MNATIPHQREIVGIIELVMEAFNDSEFLGLVITDSQEHVRWLTEKLHNSVRWDRPTEIFRGGVQVKGGGKVVIMSMSDPGRLMGLSPSKIVLFGRVGEMYYWMKSMNCPIEAVA